MLCSDSWENLHKTHMCLGQGLGVSVQFSEIVRVTLFWDILYIYITFGCSYMHMSGVWFDKSNKSWKMGSVPASPFGLEDKAPEPPGCLLLEDYRLVTNKKQEVWDTIQVTSFFPWWLLLSFKNILRQRKICTKNPEMTGLYMLNMSRSSQLHSTYMYNCTCPDQAN